VTSPTSRPISIVFTENGEPDIGKALADLCSVRRTVALSAVDRYRDKLMADGLASATINRRNAP
jgi:hypothetical protein